MRGSKEPQGRKSRQRPEVPTVGTPDSRRNPRCTRWKNSKAKSREGERREKKAPEREERRKHLREKREMRDEEDHRPKRRPSHTPRTRSSTRRARGGGGGEHTPAEELRRRGGADRDGAPVRSAGTRRIWGGREGTRGGREREWGRKVTGCGQGG